MRTNQHERKNEVNISRNELPRNAAEANRQLRDMMRDTKQGQRALPRVRGAARIARCLMLAKFGGLPIEHAQRFDYPEAVRLVLGDHSRLQRNAGHLAETGAAGGELAQASNDLLGQFAEAAVSHAALGRVGAIGGLPLEVNLTGITSGITAAITAQGAAIRVQAASFSTPAKLARLKAAAIAIFSRELLESSAAERVVGTDMLRAAALALDTEAFGTGSNGLLSGITAISSGSATPDGLVADLDELLRSLTGADPATVALVMNPLLAARLALLRNPLEGAAFPQLGARGGNIAGMPVVVSSGVEATRIVAVDGQQLALGAEPVRLEASTNATIEMSSAPTQDLGSSPPTASTAVSLFQAELAALRITAPAGWLMRRANAIGHISGVNLTGALETA
jgi:hypothetical protein